MLPPTPDLFNHSPRSLMYTLNGRGDRDNTLPCLSVVRRKILWNAVAL